MLVIARYMRVLSDDLCRRISGCAINIHHSFLSSFNGARQYARAHNRGDKISGRTAHCMTADLDEGPIREQDVVHITHAKDACALADRGRDVEGAVLALTVPWHADHNILLNDTKPVVFA